MVPIPIVTSILAVLTSTVLAGPIEQRQATSTASSTTPTVALIETTINGKATTQSVAVPTGTTTNTQTNSTTSASTAASTTDSSATSTTDTTTPVSTLFPVCKKQTTGPFCQPSNNTGVYVGNTYWVTWNADFFPVNSTVTIALEYANNSKVTAWTSDGMPREKGFVTVTMSNDWLQGQRTNNLSFIAISYSSGSDHTASPYEGPVVTLQTTTLPPPPKTGLPDKKSLLIGLPVALGGSALIVAGLFFLNRGMRRIGLGNVMGRRRGYGVGKSRRQRLGLKKGAIMLQEREVAAPRPAYRDEDEIASAPQEAQNWPTQDQRARQESLDSLVDEEESNAFRREMRAQRQQR